ncbi:MAG TPA: aldo/keto reductase [Terriglobia bacterium]|nr:aldo/keto reductase [Terriglobia bacterium]
MSPLMTRRDFVWTTAALAAGAAATRAGNPPPEPSTTEPPADSAQAAIGEEWRNRHPEMRYRQLGRTGFMISEIVCGGDPIAPDNNRHVEMALDLGLNYLDTAPDYGGGKSEEGYAAVIQGAKRDRVFVNTKISRFAPTRFDTYQAIFASLNRDEQAAILREANEDIAQRQVTVPNYFGSYFTGQMRQVEMAAISNAVERHYPKRIDRTAVYVETIAKSLEGSLRRLQTDHVDLMMCPHWASSPDEVRIPEIREAFEKLRQQGKVRYLGVSAHNDPAHVLRAAMETGVYSAAMVAYNIMNHDYVAPAIEEAHRRNFGVIAMKTAQAVFNPDRSTTPVPERAALLHQLVPGDLNLHQKAYKWALSNPHLSAAISNMVDEKQMKDNLAVVRITA